MENLKIKKLKDLTDNDMILTNGGSWLRWSPPFWPAYLVVEILEGVQRGLTADCNEVCPSQTSEGC